MGALIGEKSYNWRNYLCMVMVTLGISAIMFYKKVSYNYYALPVFYPIQHHIDGGKSGRN